MAKKIFLRDENNVKVLPITRGELVLDSSGNPAFHSNEFLATDSQPGLMSPADKQKLETVAGNTVDTELSNTSTNPVQNKVLTQIINSIREKYLKSAVVSGNKITITDQSNNTVEFVNSTYQIVTNAVDGLVPKYDAVDGTIDTQTTDWVLTNHNGTLGWYKLPTAAFSSSSVQLFVGAKSTSNNNNSNSATTNGNTYLKLFDNSTLKNQYNIKGTGLATVISDASGTITINVPTSHNQSSSDINSLTGYSKATAVAAIATTDSLNTALGKLEYKADIAYNLVKGAYDGDGTIENLEEILRVLEGIKDTETIQAIIGKYLPLTGGVIKNGATRNPLTIDTTNEMGAYINFAANGTMGAYVGYNSSVGAFIEESGTALKLKNGVATLGSYIMLHAGNYNSYAPKLDGTGATGTWGINISGNAGSANIIKGVNGSDSGGSVVYYKISNLLEKKSNYQATYIITTRNTENYYISIGIDDGGWFTPDITRMHNNYSKITNFAWKDGVLYVKSATYNNGIRITCLTNSSSIIPVISSSNATEFDAATVIPIKTNIHSGNIGSYAITAHQSLANYVTLNSAQTITGLKTFESASNTVGVSLILKNSNWAGGMSTAIDFYTGGRKTAVSSRIEDYMNGDGSAGGCLRFFTQSKSDTNPNPNGLEERMRIDNYGYIRIYGTTVVSNNIELGSYGILGFGSTIPTKYVDNAAINPDNSAVWLATTGGGGEAAGIMLDGNTIKMWSPMDNPIKIIDSDTDNTEYYLLHTGNIDSHNLTTITKSLTVTADWMDTGITSTDLSRGTYIIQVSVSGNDGTANMWGCIWSGIMSWDSQVTNDTESDEIILHRAGHAYENTIYIRTLMTPRDASGVGLKLQIAANKNIGAAYTYTFKFKRVI